MKALARGDASSLGVSPSETTLVKIAMVSRNLIHDEKRVLRDEYIGVGLGLRGKDFALSFQIRPHGTAQFLKEEPFDSLLPPNPRWP